MVRDTGLDALLGLADIVLDQGNGYWVQFKVRQVPLSRERPHGIRYSLTLHAPDGERILGFDNAHPVKDAKKGRYSANKVAAYDHQHLLEKQVPVPYEFKDANQLHSDFWKAVDLALTRVSK